MYPLQWKGPLFKMKDIPENFSFSSVFLQSFLYRCDIFKLQIFSVVFQGKLFSWPEWVNCAKQSTEQEKKNECRKENNHNYEQQLQWMNRGSLRFCDFLKLAFRKQKWIQVTNMFTHWDSFVMCIFLKVPGRQFLPRGVWQHKQCLEFWI